MPGVGGRVSPAGTRFPEGGVDLKLPRRISDSRELTNLSQVHASIWIIDVKPGPLASGISPTFEGPSLEPALRRRRKQPPEVGQQARGSIRDP